MALRISGDDLIPSEITSLLGTAPTESHTKGETGKHIVGPKIGDARVAKSGMWILDAADREPEDMNGQIGEILSKVTGDLAIWQGITGRYHVDLFCGLFLSGTYGGLSLSPRSMAALGERGIELGLCIYGGEKEEHVPPA